MAASNRVWVTPDGKAHFLTFEGVDEDDDRDEDTLVPTTIRSHDQYNTTIYGMNDRYRGISGRRDVVFVNERDLSDLGLSHGNRVDLVAGAGQGARRPDRRRLFDREGIDRSLLPGSQFAAGFARP